MASDTPRVTGIVEAALHVQEVGRSMDFYQGLFGFEAELRNDAIGVLRIPNRQALILFPRTANPQPVVNPPIALEGRTVILVDDGLATGSTMLAAATAVKGANPKSVVVAVPVAAKETCQALRSHVDDVVCAATPEPFRAVGLWYRDFAQVSDAEVHALLDAPTYFGDR